MLINRLQFNLTLRKKVNVRLMTENREPEMRMVRTAISNEQNHQKCSEGRRPTIHLKTIFMARKPCPSRIEIYRF